MHENTFLKLETGVYIAFLFICFEYQIGCMNLYLYRKNSFRIDWKKNPVCVILFIDAILEKGFIVIILVSIYNVAKPDILQK